MAKEDIKTDCKLNGTFSHRDITSGSGSPYLDIISG